MDDLAPKVSVIFPIYNNENYIEKAIRSVMNQTLQDLEIILIDDGSKDSTPQICDRLAEEDSRIQVIHKQNEGSAAGRNQGIDLAKGKYIAFVESDDSVAPDMYEKLYNRAIETNADIVKCGFYYCEGDTKREAKFFYPIAEEKEVFQVVDKPEMFLHHASMWAAIYKREFINQHHLRCIVTPSATYSDFSWSAMTYAYAERMTIYHQAFYYYTYDNPASSRVHEGEKCFYKIFHCLEANRILREAGIFEQVKEEIGYQEFCTALVHARRIQNNLRDEYFKRYRELILDITKDGFSFKKFTFIDRIMANTILKDNKIRAYHYLDFDNRLLSFSERHSSVNKIWWGLKNLKYKLVQ